MARYTGPSCRVCRREGVKLYIKGDRCYTGKCSFTRREYAPGQHGQLRKKMSDYGIQLREKQKARKIYGVLESQFRNYFQKAVKSKGLTGQALVQLLESRFDNMVFRLGLASSRPEARQLVRHGHFTINGKKVNIPSCLLKVGDEIGVKEKSRNIETIKSIQESTRSLPKWLELNKESYMGKVLAMPLVEEVDLPVKLNYIIELYSK